MLHETLLNVVDFIVQRAQDGVRALDQPGGKHAHTVPRILWSAPGIQGGADIVHGLE